MKTYIHQISIFIFLIFFLRTTLFILPVLYNLPEIKYNGFFGDIHQGKKLVIAGASNAEYNFNYEKIQEEFPEYGVVGSSTDEPSGLMVILHKLRLLNLDSNDIVVLCLPHSLYSKNKFLPIKGRGKQISKEVITNSFEFSKVMTLSSLLSVNSSNIFDALHTRELDRKRVTESKIYNAMYEQPLYNDSLYLCCYHNTEDKFHIEDNHAEFDLDYLKFLKSRISDFLGARVYFRLPVLPFEDFSLNEAKTEWLQQNFPFINDLSSSIIDKNLFYNQWYHLNRCGADANTKSLVKELDFLKQKSQEHYY